MLGKIYAILSDANKRAVYDEDGTIDEGDDATLKQVSKKTGLFMLAIIKIIMMSCLCHSRECKNSI